MAVDVLAVPTEAWREKIVDALQNAEAITRPVKFKVGEGGFVLVGGNPVPKTPDPALTDLESVSDISLFTFEKVLDPGDLSEVDPKKFQATCFVDTGEANDDGTGNPPTFFEIGIFDTDDTMIAYGTFPGAEKTVAITLTFRVRVKT